ncbi:MAG TPA: hypothetical protein VFE24_16860 [Pirellulales bacterium]|jgi:hypothetical protein|nr:hypothetical protein [Pirellulales bacterium]
MKHTFVIAVLTSSLVIPSAAVFGQGLFGQGLTARPINTAAAEVNIAGAPQGAAPENAPAAPETLAAPNGGQANLQGNPQQLNPQQANPPQGLAPQANGAQAGGPPADLPQGNPGAAAAPQGGVNLNPAFNGNSGPNMVKEGESRGGLGNLASGAPSFSKNLMELHGRLDGEPTLGMPGAAVKGEATTVTTGVTAVQTKKVEHGPEMARFLCDFVRKRANVRRFMPGFGPMGMMPQFEESAPPFGDLVLVDLQMVSDSTPEHGPVYRLSMLNDSPLPSCDFHVSLIAARGDINESSVVVTMPIRMIQPKQTGFIDIELPIGCLSLGAPAQPFDTVIAVVDSFDELAETNELNNIATLSRTDIVHVTVKTEAIAAPAGGASVAPAPGLAPAAAGLAAPAGAPANGGEQGPAVAPNAPEGNGAAPAGPPAPAGAGPNGGNGAAQGTPQAAPAVTGLDNLDLEKVQGANELFERK